MQRHVGYHRCCVMTSWHGTSLWPTRGPTRRPPRPTRGAARPTRGAPRPTRGAQVGGPKPGPSGWAKAGPKWVGPSWAQVGGPKLGPSQKLETQKNPKNKILKIKIHVAQNVGKVWISRKKSPGPTWGHLGPFFPWTQQMQNMNKCCLFSLVGQWALFTRFAVMCWCH